MTEIESLSREFAELAGVCWHSPYAELEFGSDSMYRVACSKCGQQGECRQDFTDAREVIRVMREREDWKEFTRHLGVRLAYSSPHLIIDAFSELIEDRTGLMLIEAVEWLRGREKDVS